MKKLIFLLFVFAGANLSAQVAKSRCEGATFELKTITP